MNKDQVKGMIKKAQGKVNEAVGKATGNKTQELRGDLQQAEGAVRKSYGDAKQQVKKHKR